MTETPQYSVDVRRVRLHYDRLSFLYERFWGEHLHHGYWNGGETPKQAQIQWMEQLARRAGIARGSNLWRPDPGSFDVVWIMESSEHFPDKKGIFERCAAALRPGGTLAVCAWLRRDGPLLPDEQPLVATIAEAMMSASLDSLSSYREWMRNAGLTVTAAEDITRRVEPTWAHCARIGAKPAIRFLVHFTGGPTQRFVRSFPLMQETYASGAIAFGLFVAKTYSVDGDLYRDLCFAGYSSTLFADGR